MSRGAGGSTDGYLVAVIGGGPVGLCVAIGLRQFGVDCVVLERHGSTLDFPKGRRVTVRSVEIFRRWHLEEAVAAASLPRDESLFVFNGETLLADHFRRRGRPIEPVPTSPTAELICSQGVLEPILLDHARGLGVEVRFSHEVTALEPGDSGVAVRVADLETGGEATVGAEYVVAADGSRSRTRDMLGITRTVLGDMGARISILVEADLVTRMKDRTAGLYVVDQPPPGVTFAAVDNRKLWLLMTAYDPVTTPPDWFTDQRCVDMARAGIGDPQVPVNFVGRRFWQAVAAVADRFAVGRVFFAGDAAHVTTPVGGLGMNVGVADTDNLAWKLAGVLNGWAHPNLLDTYECERHQVAISAANASLGTARPPKRIDGLVLGTNYVSPLIVPDGSPPPTAIDPVSDYTPTARPGARAPHMWIPDAHPRTSTIDLFGPTFVAFTDRTGAQPLHSAAVEARTTGIPLAVNVIDAEDFCATYGIRPAGVVLVRPDGHVAFRSPSACSPAKLAAALKTAAGWPA